MRLLVSGADSMNPKNPLISAVIITKNEAVRIGKCLAVLSFCDEILVIDNGSTDNTADIARQNGAKVITDKDRDFAALRNTGKDVSHGDWILYIDADEIVTPQLADSVKYAIRRNNAGNFQYFLLRRVNYYLGHRWPVSEKMPRLFNRTAFQGWSGVLHESPQVNGKCGELTGDLLHDTHRNLEEMVVKTNAWSDTEAMLRFKSNHPPVVWWRLLRVMCTGFCGSYFGQSGWRAGTVGFVESIYQAFSMFITYAKLFEMQNRLTKELIKY
jgi:glycosyltransferase involved in cell wall biosynthesis